MIMKNTFNLMKNTDYLSKLTDEDLVKSNKALTLAHNRIGKYAINEII